MFSQKKRKTGVLWILVVLLLIFAAIFLIVATLGNNEQKPTKSPDVSTISEDVPKSDESKNQDAVEDNDKEDKSVKEIKPYYLVKLEGDAVKIFFYNKLGEETELENTNIVFDTLSPDDQNRFKRGIKVESRDELNRIIMDYES